MQQITRVIGGTVWSEDGPLQADLVLDAEGKVEALEVRGSQDTGARDEKGPRLEEGGVIDATGLWLLPGAVDVHVHFRDPGLVESEDFLTGSAAAALGGVTTVLDMPNTLPPVGDPGALGEKIRAVAGRSYVDYGLFGAAVAEREDDLLAAVEAMAALGACGIKVFLGPTTGDIQAPGWGALYELCRHFGKSGLVFTFHCEDRDVIQRARARRRRLDPADYQSLLQLRPRFGELLATDGVLRLALETGARVHIAHVALKEAVVAIAQAKRWGAQVTAETCPQYLLLSDGDYPVHGPAMKALPPIRSAGDREALWQGLLEGAIDLVATDHAPHRRERSAHEAVWEPPFGIAGVQTMLPLLLDQALQGACTVSDVVRWTSANPARAYGLYPQKGSLLPGADADVALVDPEAEWRVDETWWKGKSRNTPFWGRRGKGLPVATLVRGRLVSWQGTLAAEPQGRFLANSAVRG